MKRYLLVISLLFTLLSSAVADSWMNYSANYSEGKEFYVTYMHANTQAGVTDLDIALFIAARQRATVTISDALTNQVIATVTIPATSLRNSYYMWSSSRNTTPSWFQVQDYYCTASNTVYPRSIRVTSTTDISLYMANSAASSSDASLVLPTNRLGREYVVQNPTLNAEACEFAIVAVKDGTSVTITPTASIANPGGSSLPALSPITQYLNKGQVYFLAASSVGYDLSGTKICASQDVMVFNGSQSMNSPAGVQGHVCHETTPLAMWGKKFPLVMMSPQNYNIVKLTAQDSAATLTIHYNAGSYQIPLAAYSSYEIPWNSITMGNAIYIESTAPVVCYQYMLARADQQQTPSTVPPFSPIYNSGGRPSSTIITPIEQGIKSAMFGTFQDNIHHLTYYVDIVCPTANLSTMQMDGVAIPVSQFTPMPGPGGLSYVSKQISDSAHSLTNSAAAFTAITYGLTSPNVTLDWSYAYNVGMNCQRNDAYMLIDGERKNYAAKCKNNDDQWVWDFNGIVNYGYDSIAWYYDRGRMGGGDSLHYTFNLPDSLLRDIYMIVYHTTPICLQVVADTIRAQVNNAMTYNKVHPIEYHCRPAHDTIIAFPGTAFHQIILADTVPLNTTRTIKHRFDSQSGCDSIVHFRYQVRDPQDVTENRRICQGSSTTYKGYVMTAAGSYPFDEYDVGGCHYTKTIVVTVDPTYDIHIYDTICDKEVPYLWRHSATDIDTFRQTTPDFVRHFRTIHNCDSAVHLHLIVGQSYSFTLTDSACDNQLPYMWRNRPYSKAGVYYDSLLTRHRCDSVYKLKLTILPTYYTADTAVICDNQTYSWRGRTLSAAGLYWDSLHTRHGCDSVFSLLLRQNPTYLFPSSMTVCQNGSVTWRTRQISAPAAGTFTYYDSLKTHKGCDSVFVLNLTVNPIYTKEVFRSICKGGTYEFAGTPARTWMNNVVGHHRDTAHLSSRHGCDSMLILRLTVNPVYNYDTSAVTCTNVPFHWVQGDMDTLISQTTPGQQHYYSNHKSVHGCDSNYHLSLVSNNVLIVQRTVTISDRDSVMWDGKVYAGTKYTSSTPDSVIRAEDTPLTIDHMYQSRTTGCDSLMRLVITVGSTYEIEERVTTCRYQPYNVAGHNGWTWRKDIVGTHDTICEYRTSLGHDSIRHIYLTVYPVYSFKDTARTCSNQDFTWQGHMHIGYKNPGTYTYHDNYQTVNECDSNYELLLIVQDTIVVPTVKGMCDVDTFRWDGTLFAGNKSAFVAQADIVLTPNTYNYKRTYVSATDCDSFVTLHLDVYPTYEFYDTVETCQYSPYHPNDDDPTFWTLHKDTAGVYDDIFRLSTIHGCDSVRHLHLTVHPEYTYPETQYTCCNSAFVWAGHERIQIGQKPVGTYTIYDSLFTARYGCDSVHILQLIVQDTIINPTTHEMCDVDTFRWDGTLFAGNKSAFVAQADIVLTPNAYNYKRTYVSATDCDSFVTLHLDVYPTYEFYDTVETCQYSPYHPNDDDPTFWTLHKDTAGVYDDIFRLSTIHGCDSVRHLHLTVHPEYTYPETQYTCCNSAFVWAGHERIQIGQKPVGTYTIYDSLFTARYGCDSVHILQLIVQDTIINPTTHEMCDVDTFRWDGTLFAGNKSAFVAQADIVLTPNPYDYRRTYLSATDCDSFVTLHLDVYPTYEFYDTVETCQYSPYHPNDDDPTFWTLHKDTAGVYDDIFRLSTINGCDSVRHLHLTVHPEYTYPETQYTCCNSEFVWSGHERIQIGQKPVGTYTFRDSLLTDKYGCDSVHILQLIVQDTIINPTTHEMCDVDTFRWDGTLFAGNKSAFVAQADIVLTPNTYNYKRTYPSATGCDSFVTLRLTVYPTYEFYDTVETCQYSPYHPNDDDPTFWTLHKDTAGVYDDIFRLSTINGCDSVRHLHLTVHPEYTYPETQYTCCNSEFVWSGHERIQIGQKPVGTYTIYDSLFTARYGCDSVHILQLIVQDTIINPTTHEMCDVDTFRWDGTLFAGNKSAFVAQADIVLTPNIYDYRRTYVSATGCDSFVTLRITVYPTYEFYDTIVTCQHDSYSFQGQTWTWRKNDVGIHDTTYYYQTIRQCDSIWHVHLTVNPVYFYPETAATCANEPYVWVGHNRTFANLSPGQHIFYDSLKTHRGCDSVHRLTLNVVDTIVMNTYRTICDNDTVIWQGSLFRGDHWPGVGGTVLGDSAYPYVFNRLYTSVMTGCDSIERLVLTVRRTDLTILPNTSICQYETFRFGTHDIPCNREGTFTLTDSLLNIYGCDSIVKVTLRVDSVYHYDTYMTICDNSTWTWRGHTYINLPSGTYNELDHYQTIHGCDSDYQLHLTVVHSYLFIDTLSMCDDQVTTWRTHSYGPMAAGVYIYTDSLKTVGCGCDSVYRLILKVHSTYLVHDTLSMCDNETIQVRWHSIHGSAGIYHFVDTLPSIYNCDSVIDLTVYINPTYHFVEHASICSNETYDWHGRTFRLAGTYYDSLLTQYGCDSVYELHLHVKPAYLFESYRTICDNESIVFQGVILRDDGDHHFKYYTEEGCDSEYVLHLTVLPTYWIDLYETICDNQFYNFAGRRLNHSGVYYDSTRTRAGCDSVTVLHLTVHPTYHFIHNAEICSNENYQWQGNTYNQSGVYYDSLLTEYGCDSILELRLTVHKAYYITIDTAICDYQTFRWGGRGYTRAGVYKDSNLTVHGCDSIYTINLSVITTLRDTLYDTICTGDVYTFGTQQLTKSGIYHDTICQPMVDDCRFRTLYLLVNDPTDFVYVGIPDICTDDLEFLVKFRWQGGKPVRYSFLFDDNAHKQGFEDIVNQDYSDTIFIPVPPCEPYKTYVRPDHYQVTMQLDNGGCDPAATQYVGDLLVKYPSWIIEQNWNDVVSLLNKHFNGGYDFTSYYWVVDGVDHMEERGSYIYWPGRLQMGDNVHVMLQRENENYYIPSCDITIINHQGMSVNGNDLPFFVINPDPQGALKITTLVDGDYIVTDAAGRRIAEGTIRDGETVEVDANCPAGIYFVYFYTSDGRSVVRKVLIH